MRRARLFNYGVCTSVLVAMLCLAHLAHAGDFIERQFGAVVVALRTADVPSDFAAAAPGTAAGYSGFSSVLVRLDIKISGRPVYVPLDAFAGLGDPRSMDVQEVLRDKRWRLKIAGGDAGTSYCAVMEFDSTQVHAVSLLRSCAAKVPFATKRYAKLEILN